MRGPERQHRLTAAWLRTPRVASAFTLSPLAFDLRAQDAQALDERSVTSLNGFERRDATFPLGRERGRDQRHSRSQIAAVQRSSLQLRRAADDDPVWIAEEKIRAHRAH